MLDPWKIFGLKNWLVDWLVLETWMKRLDLRTLNIKIIHFKDRCSPGH